MTFDQTYTRVKAVQPSDPLEKYGLSMINLGQLLKNCENDPKVWDLTDEYYKMMGEPDPSSDASEKMQEITVNGILEVRQFMLKEWEILVSHLQEQSNGRSYEMKTLTLAAQAIIDCKVEQQFASTTEEIESIVLISKQHLGIINAEIEAIAQGLKLPWSYRAIAS